MELAIVPWPSISMYFIVYPPKSNEHTHIWITADRFTMMAHLVTMKDDAKTLKDLAKKLFSDIWHVYRLPTDIVSERDKGIYEVGQKYVIRST
jgi:hypothetical protein